MYPVETVYLKEPSTNYVVSAVQAVWNIHLHVSTLCTADVLNLGLIHSGLQQPRGDILVFLTGREEIDTCAEELAEKIPKYASFSC